MKIEFTIIGECVSMKNSRQLLYPGGNKAKPPMFTKSKEARMYEAAVIRQIPKSAKLMLECDLRATVILYYASRRKDVDAELLFDALSTKYAKVPGDMIRTGEGQYERGPDKRVLERAGVYLNDRQIRIKIVDGSEIDKENPRAILCFEPIEAVQARMFHVERTAPRGTEQQPTAAQT